MKKIILSIACAASFCACDAQHQLTVKFANLANDTVRVSLVSEDFRSMEKADPVVAQNGVITYDVEGDGARMLNLSYRTAEGPGRLQVYAVPGEQGTLTMGEQGGTWTGTKFFTDLAAYEAVKDPIENELSQISVDFQRQVSKGANADSIRKVVMPRYQELSKKLAEVDQKFINENPNSDVSATILMGAPTEENLAKLGDNVKNGKFAAFINYIKSTIERKKALDEAKKTVAEGMVAPDFTLKDINGNDLALSSLRGKYVVLDFWGSWCGWCIKGFPEMKEYYKKYAGKFEILGIDCNDTEDKWKKAVADNDLPWKHVYNPRNGDVTTKYAVSGYPTKIILDPEGKIYKTIVGESPEFYTVLDNLFGK